MEIQKSGTGLAGLIEEPRYRKFGKVGDRGACFKYHFGETMLKQIDVERRLVPAMVSMGSRDRAGDSIKPEAYQLTNYRKNPVVLWVHDYYGLPVGRSIQQEVRPEGLYAVTEFADHALASDVFDLYALDFMRAWSVGIDPLEWTARYESVDGADRFTGYDFTKVDLLEYSPVPVPMHQDALTESIAVDDDRAVPLARALAKGYFQHYRKAIHDVAASPGTPTSADEREILAEIHRTIDLMRVDLELRSMLDRQE
jgi:HK97 family phage prohead protease